MTGKKDNSERFIADEREYKFTINGKNKNIIEEIDKREKDELFNAMQKYMPIGSVVKIKKSFQSYMIIGFKSQSGDMFYDYLACEYPFGLDANHSISMFNHDEIEKVFHIGFVNEYEKTFKKQYINDTEYSDLLFENAK